MDQAIFDGTFLDYVIILTTVALLVATWFAGKAVGAIEERRRQMEDEDE
jgi:hypothetical protein